jgi:Nuclease-related domain
MIVKDLDPFTSTDKLERAGRAAEEQLSFYLQREFSRDTSIRVFNNVRLERQREVAQLDHLILYRHGAIIIESKSSHGEVRINQHGEWSRGFNGRFSGMPSPILQAQRQGQILRLLLQDHATELLDKVFGVIQKQFGALHLQVIVAISDTGVIQRPKGQALEEVCKADQVPQKARATIARLKEANSPLGLLKLSGEGGYSLSDAELERITAFLLKQHRPLKSAPVVREVATPPAPPVVPASVNSSLVVSIAKLACRHCSSDRLEIVFGQYGYYFKCHGCQGNTPIQTTPCPSCQGKVKVRKAKLEFFLDCPNCRSSHHYYTNPI